MKIQSVKGFHDVLPEDCTRWTEIEKEARRVFAAYDFREIRIPIVERSELFGRSLGAASDIVEKEMYTFLDRDETSLTLRPEGTASVVRAFVEHALYQEMPSAKLFYLGPMFRRERPQKGRLRQFSQIGVEMLGRNDPAADAEVLLLLSDLLAAFGVGSATIEINTLGCRDCRPAYRDALVEWGKGRIASLCSDCVRRLEVNPLRLLDCKQPGCMAQRDSAPRMLERCCEACRAHFDRVLALLRAEGVEPQLQPYMVRGLDYYCRTAFEVVASGLGAQNAVGGGGRYDGLVKDLGGPDVAGVGFALGVERLALVLDEAGKVPRERPEFAVLPVGLRAESAAFGVAHRLRGGGARVALESAEKSLKSQMRQADKQGARYAIILGDDEITHRALTVRDLEAKRDMPRAVGLDCSLEQLRGILQ